MSTDVTKRIDKYDCTLLLDFLSIDYRRKNLKRRGTDWLVTMPLSEVLSLPERVSAPGVYFLFAGPELQYIGTSSHMRARITKHKSESRIPFDSSRCLCIAEKDRREVLELEYIQAYQPALNKAGRG